jgi:hypothetical protein
MHQVRTALQNQKEFIEKRTSFDPLHNLKAVGGDEVPPGCIEVAYLPSVFHGHGSALALRTPQHQGRVEWLIFIAPVDQSFLAQVFTTDNGGSWTLEPLLHPNDPRKVFNLVGFCEKGLATRTVRGTNREHKGWHDSLCRAEEWKQTLKLTWKGFGTDLKGEYQRRQLKERGERREYDDEEKEEERGYGDDTLIDVQLEWNDGYMNGGLEVDKNQMKIRNTRKAHGGERSSALTSREANALPRSQKP